MLGSFRDRITSSAACVWCFNGMGRVFRFRRTGSSAYVRLRMVCRRPQRTVGLLDVGRIWSGPMIVFRSKEGYYQPADYFRSLPVRCGHALLASGPSDGRGGSKLQSRDFTLRWIPGRPVCSQGIRTRKWRTPRMHLLCRTFLRTSVWVSLIHFVVDFDAAKEITPELAFAEVNIVVGVESVVFRVVCKCSRRTKRCT